MNPIFAVVAEAMDPKRHRAILKAKRLSTDAKLPKRATVGACGLDLYACGTPIVTIPRGGSAVIRTGISVEIHSGFEGQIRSRSGLAARHGVAVLNSPGTIDSDFRGELLVVLHNHGGIDFDVKAGDRIAQLVIAPVVMCDPVEVDELGDTVRGCSGLGSTGVRDE